MNMSHPLTGYKHDKAFREKARLRQLGKKPSKSNLDKLRMANTGRKKTKEELKKSRLSKLGDKNPMFGKKPTNEHRLKISESLRKTLAKNKNVSFQKVVHELRNCSLYRLWRESVFFRDHFACTWCADSQGGNLVADHIKPFGLILRQHMITSFEEGAKCDELWRIENGRTLCEMCHMQTDTWGAKAKKLWR